MVLRCPLETGFIYSETSSQGAHQWQSKIPCIGGFPHQRGIYMLNHKMCHMKVSTSEGPLKRDFTVPPARIQDSLLTDSSEFK